MSEPQDLATWKKTQRQRLLEQRAALSVASRTQIEMTVLQTLKSLLEKYEPAELSFYWPIKGEIDCRSLADNLLATGWQLSVPVIDVPNKRLIFARWTPDSEMVSGTWNIPVPRHIVNIEPEVMLIPLVGFDTAGYRLGYGGGYYDRTLAGRAQQKIKIGVGHAFSEMPTIHPNQYDIQMDIIVTELGRCTTHK